MPRRAFLDTPLGKGLSIVFVTAGMFLLAASVRRAMAPSSAAAASATRIFICAETGKAFNHTLRIGDRIPVVSPYSRKPTGFVAELCNWTADGKTAAKITPVLLNSARNPATGMEPTFCPDCDRLVVPLNPLAERGLRPPPTRAEYMSRFAKREG